jgi:hypothetical protein
MREVIDGLPARSGSSVASAHYVAVGEQRGLHSVRKPSDGAASSGYLLRILSALASGCGDQQTKDPDCSLVGVTSLRNPIHSSLGVAADGGKLSAETSIQSPAFTG